MKAFCIFDLDGTVLDTVGSIAHYGNLALAQNGIETIEPDAYRFLAGDGSRTLVHRMLAMRGCDTEEQYARVHADYNLAYNAAPTHKTRIFDGLKPVLDALKAEGVRMVIVSNKPELAARAVAEALYGKGYFEEIIGQCEGIPLKPDPTAVLEVIRRAGVPKEACIYIGDTSTDMQTGKNAGLFTVGVLWGFRDRAELLSTGADALAETPQMLGRMISEYQNRSHNGS